MYVGTMNSHMCWAPKTVLIYQAGIDDDYAYKGSNTWGTKKP